MTCIHQGHYQPKINGLPNIELSCSINAVIQVLAQTPELAELLKTEVSLNDSLCRALILVIHDINGERRPAVDVHDDLQLIRRTLFKRDSEGNVELQDDSHLLLMRLINYMKDIGLTEAAALFQIELIDILEYNCKCMDINPDQLSYSLAIPLCRQKMSVNGGLEVLLREEHIHLGCRKCSNKQEEGKCTRRLCIKKMPYIIVLQLPRQTVTPDGMPSKLYSMIGYEENIAIQDADSKQFNYELYGLIEHLGSLDDGHYIAHVLKCYTGTSRIWYRCSDENVTESMLPPTQVNDAYLLFYKQK